MKLDKKTIIPALEKAVRHTFENTLFVDFDEAKEVAKPELNLYDQLTFIRINSPFGGELQIAISYDLAFKILKSMYNENDNVLMMMVDEIMAEICNTVTGCFLAEVVPADMEFNFSLPTCTKINREKINQDAGNSIAMQFVLQDKPVYCIFKN